MGLSTAIQEALLALLCFSEQEGSIAASMLEDRHFDPVYRDIAIRALEYRERHKQAPDAHTLDFFNDAIDENPDQEKLFERLHSSIKKTAIEINAQYVLDRARAFVRKQNLKRALSTAIRDLEQDDEEGLLAAESTLSSALTDTQTLYHPGTFFLEDVKGSLAFLDDWDASFPTGIPEFDRKGLGPVRRRLHLFIAAAKKGKSWWLINLATRAHQHAKKVLYVSCELEEPELCQRMCQSFFAVSKRRMRGLEYQKFIPTDDRRDWGTEFDVVKVGHTLSMTHKDIRRRLVEKMGVHGGGERLVLRGFPIGTLTTKQLDGYLDFLENRERFIPDLILVDYVDIMKLPPKLDRWQGLIDVTQNLRRIAQERNVAVATVTQTNVSGSKARRTDVHHVSGAWDKIATADTVFTYSQTDEEFEDHRARIFVAAARTEAARFEVLISQLYDIGQFVLSSTRLGINFHKKEEQ